MAVSEGGEVQSPERILAQLLEAEVVPLNRQSRRHRSTLLQSSPSAGRPVIDTLGLTSQPSLEEIAVLPQIVQHARKPCFLGPGEALGEIPSKAGYGGQVLAERVAPTQ
jgi:hypothetical protein